jgi:hypothetical protein
MKKIIVCLVLMLACFMPLFADIVIPTPPLGRIIPDNTWFCVNSEPFIADYNIPRWLAVTTGIAFMIVGNQDRNTLSGNVLQLGGLVLTVTWTF